MRHLLVPLALMFLAVSVLIQRVQAAEPLVRVMTFNLRYATAPDGENAWEKRSEFLFDVIREFEPDLLGTQEVPAVQADFLAEKMPGYQLVGVGRDDGVRKGEFSAIFFRKSRFELVDSGTFWLSETPEQAGSKSWDSSLPRIATWAKLRDRENGGRELCFLNTHWDHRGNQARLEAGKIIRAWLADHAKNMSIIMIGDLNVHDDHPGYLALTGETPAGSQLRDAYREAHPQAQPDEGTAHGFRGNARGRRIDFVFHTADSTAVEAAINRTSKDGRFPSDHFPVTAVIRFGK